MRLYDFLSSGNGYKVRLVLHQLGIPFERVEVDILSGETRRPEFLARNANGRIPLLELPDGTLPRRVERDPLLPGGRHAAPAGRPARACAGAAVDVLRAVQPRAQRRDVALLAAAPRADRRSAARPSPRSAASATRRSRSWSSTWRRDRTSSASATRSRTSPSTPTRTSPTRAASTWRPTPRYAPGWRGSRRQPGHVPITSGLTLRRSRRRRAAPAAARRRRPSRAAPRRCARPPARAAAGSRARVRLKRGAGAGCDTPATSMKVPRAVMCGCSRRLLHRQHRREADVATFHDGAPLGTRPGLEQRGELLLQLRPARLVHLVRQALAGEAEALEQLLVELRLDRADRHVLPVLALVGVVEVRAGVEQVRAATLVPEARVAEAVEHRHQDRRAVDHRRIDHLPLARALALDQRARHAEREHHRAAAEVADQVERRQRRLARRARSAPARRRARCS